MNSKKKKDEEYDLRFEEALLLRDSGRPHEALNILSQLLSYDGNRDAGILALMGDIYGDANEPAESTKCFQKAVELAPTAEIPSLGLFHALWDSGDRAGAFAELKRFLSIAQSEEHFRLIEEMRDAAFPEK